LNFCGVEGSLVTCVFLLWEEGVVVVVHVCTGSNLSCF
jgi:hypothetical protein